MTVKGLIELLGQFDGDTPVLRVSPSGDYWGNVLAKVVDKYETDIGWVKWSEYHREWKTVDFDGEMGGEMGEDGTFEVLLLG